MRIIKTEVFLPGGKTSKKGEKCLGDRDTLTKNYVKRADRFADIFNYYLFDGKRRIDPAQLREQDTAQIVLPYGKDLTEMPMQRFRDILKQAVLMTDGHCQYVLLGIENQSDVHYAMAVRSYLYDAIEYAAQVQTIACPDFERKTGWYR